MAFGIYIHIPYCIQRCHYCDFATYVQDQILPPAKYFELLKKEFFQNRNLFKQTQLTSLYFGGGTPSLVPPELIADFIYFLSDQGFQVLPDTEITLEVNPATLTAQKLEIYKKAGVNRLSVGSQTFNDKRLKELNREHSADDTIKTLSLIQEFKFNFSFDLLYSLPHQTQSDFMQDLNFVEKIRPHHISPYILTLPQEHFLNIGRPEEDIQIEMFQSLDSRLKDLGYEQYEISNYCLPGFQSRHNLLYWDDQEYWGLGLSAHSYQNVGQKKTWGRRFWNERNIENYQTRIECNLSDHPDALSELLTAHEALTDYCHTSLRKISGLNLNQLDQKFAAGVSALVIDRLATSRNRELVKFQNDQIQLTPPGQLLSNQIFAQLVFDRSDLDHLDIDSFKDRLKF